MGHGCRFRLAAGCSPHPDSLWSKCAYTIQSGVLIALLGTTTANIIGLPLVLLKGLYPKEEEISKLNEEIAQFTNMRQK